MERRKVKYVPMLCLLVILLGCESQRQGHWEVVEIPVHSPYYYRQQQPVTQQASPADEKHATIIIGKSTPNQVREQLGEPDASSVAGPYSSWSYGGTRSDVLLVVDIINTDGTRNRNRVDMRRQYSRVHITFAKGKVLNAQAFNHNF
jgi:hypothetical protein